jgi:hypothetical protein
MKTKMLKGLSYNLAQSYFSTLCYYEKGYMSDWIVNSANDLGIDKIEINILDNLIFPDKLNIRPLLIYLDNLKQIIDMTLESNELPKDFITEAKFKISINEKREVICENYVKGENNKIFKPKDFIEQSYEIFDTNLTQ